MTDIEAEQKRIQRTYARRDAGGKPFLYSWHRQEVLLSLYRFRAVTAKLLAANGYYDLSKLEVLDIGCGIGGWLRTLMEWGATPERLHGIDLLDDRIHQAKVLAPLADFRVASGYQTPFSDSSMDLVSSHTVFSSILDPTARELLSQEMIRVLRSSGIILIYDFRLSDPRNADTIGIRKREIQRLFPFFRLQFCSLTLAPPLARKIVPVCPSLAHVLEAWFPLLRSHALYFLSRRGKLD